ncbi:tetratricopeptide repeat protein [Bacteroidota bacterium]
MKFKYQILFFVLILCSQVLRAQNNSAIDSLLQILKNPVHDTTKVNVFADLSEIMGKSFPDSATAFAEKGIKLAKKINYKKGEANLYKNIGNINWSRGHLDQAVEDFNKALKLYTKQSESPEKSQFIDAKKGIAYCYNGIGIVWFLKGNYSKALEYFQLSLENHEKVNNKPGISKCYNNIGLVHWKQDNLERAIEYFEKSLSIQDELGNYKEMAGGYNNMAIIYKKQKKYDEALKYYNKSLEILLAEDNRKGIALCYNNIGILYEDLKKFDTAFEFYNKALELRIKIDDKKGIASTYGSLASLNNKIAKQTNNNAERIKKYYEAIEYAKSGLNLSREIGVLYQEMDLYEVLYNSYEGLGKFNESLKYYKLRTELKDSLFNKDKNKQIEEAEAKYQSAQKQQEIEKQKTELEKQKTFRNYLIIFAILIVLLIIVLYSRFILKQRTNTILEEKNRELQKLSIVASETDNAITICDAEGNFEWVNEGLIRLFGYTLEERKKIHGNNIFEASTNPKIKKIIERVKKDKKSVIYESTIKTSKGEIRNLQTTLTPFLNKNGEIQKLIFIDTDISELKEAEQEILQKNEEISVQKEELEKHRYHLEQVVNRRTKDLKIAKEKAEESDRLKSSFLANMSHEIRTPMNAIIGYSDLLSDNQIDSDSKNNLISEISTNCYSLLNIIDNVLDLARIDTNQLKVQKEKFSLDILITSIYNSYLDVINLKKLKFELLIPKKNIEIFSDEYRIKQIFSNLIDNSIKFTEKGKIEIGYNINPTTIEFFIKDTGIGLSIDQQNHIFNRFTKIEDDKRKLYRGAGLGLAICRNIVKLINGDIWVESEPEKGAAFYFTIPYHKDEQKIKSEVENTIDLNESVNWSDKIILIAEDEDNNYHYFEMLIKNTKAKILRAENGKEAVEICKTNNIDLVLMDIKMPVMDGLEATKILKKEKPELPIISVSAFSSKEDVELSKNAGCKEHLSKPIQKTLLLNKIKTYIEK